MKKFFLMVPAFLTFLSAAAQNQKLNFEAPLQILDDHSGNVSPRYASDVSFTMMPTFIKNGKGLVGLLETCHGVTWDDHLFTGLGAGASYSFFTEEVFIPVFAEGRYTLSGSGRFMPFFSLRLGGLFCTERKSNNFTVNPSIGVSLKRLSFSAGYQFLTGMDENWLPIGFGSYGWVKTPSTSHGLTFRIAFFLF